MNEHDLADKFFGETVHRDVELIPRDQNLTQSLEDVTAANEAHRDSLRNLELSAGEGEELTRLIRGFMSKPASEADREAWLRETSETMSRAHGPDGARQRLEVAKELAKKDARLHDLLSKANLLNHPRVTAIFAERGWSRKQAGRL